MSAGRDFSSEDEAFTSMFPIHRACRDGDVGALLSLYQHHTHLTAEDSCYGWTPIHWAARCGQLECVMRLVQMGCDVNTVSSRLNLTPTHTAAIGGHPRCVLWLSQAGADVNRQDFLGEAPLHKAARAASMECIQVLLIAGAKLHLRNTSGQTAADLALTHGFHDCLHLISNLQENLRQFSALQTNGERNGNSPGLLCRKRLQSAFENGQMKKARRDGFLLMQHSALENSMDSICGNVATVTDSVHPPSPVDHDDEPMKSIPACDEVSTRLSWQRDSSPSQLNSAEMCGSLHMTESPNSCVSHRPALQSLLGADCGEFLHYGHYHGFGDTAEELSDRAHIGPKSFQNAESTMHLCQDS
ncbi:ankyrin repeat domain-containing protein 10a isoform X2 [Syngnathoides biaculeatus]|uniref:ankyrin repeat domain-containing protein 10a isoform X2 n=1 Tax=Syngnathoides biaculeatus TaxID=300417 RepID=UPI002ADE8822|nr:ankyrin repeat domain-containing protein 10a isoform X2 [Syngnathoides biaculeatus]